RRGTSSVQPQMPPPHDQSIMFEKLRESGGNSTAPRKPGDREPPGAPAVKQAFFAGMPVR
ncbi:hypothetical protein ACPCHT_38565, partial [Nucisporomicrobium flavum]|uniref:hypothetical protein n=1 Tax=Nucisporomicrobium flavum TaxID=2785915 RepID=UPI003C2FC3DE